MKLSSINIDLIIELIGRKKKAFNRGEFIPPRKYPFV